MEKLLNSLHRKLALGPVLEALDQRLSPSELNSFLLALFRRKATRVTPADLLRQYRDNRFVAPAAVDTLALRQTELDWLRAAKAAGFTPLTLSPLAPLGTCPAMAHVDQNNVVSALRGTEIVSDITNVLALQIARDAKATADKQAVFRYAATHRHVRAQAFDHPDFTAHFAVFGLASGGRDRGDYRFEREALKTHLTVILQGLRRHFPADHLFIRFYEKEKGGLLRKKLEKETTAPWRDLPVEFQADPGHAYYDLLQFKVFLRTDNGPLDLADGGPVAWTRRLLSDRKQRCFISGVGLELVHKLEKKNS